MEWQGRHRMQAMGHWGMGNVHSVSRDQQGNLSAPAKLHLCAPSHSRLQKPGKSGGKKPTAPVTAGQPPGGALTVRDITVVVLLCHCTQGQGHTGRSRYSCQFLPGHSAGDVCVSNAILIMVAPALTD